MEVVMNIPVPPRSRPLLPSLFTAVMALGFSLSACADFDDREEQRRDHFNARDDRGARPDQGVQVGPRPYYLVNDMDAGALKQKLKSCADGPFAKTDFSIGHRGAPLQFPEHTKESYEAAARMGAGIVECDVTFTQDRQLVCRHSQCDLHTTTNILAVPALAAKCTQPFTPADPIAGTPAAAQCCTSDITAAEFKTLQGKMDAFNPKATTVEQYMDATPNWRTDLYAGKGTLLTHRESIALFRKLGVKMTPELKEPSVPMPFNGYTQQRYAQQMIDEYKEAGISPRDVFPQSFRRDDVLFWIRNEPLFGQQAVFLDDLETPAEYPSRTELEKLRAKGVRIIAPPIWALLDVDAKGRIVPSTYARDAKAAGLDIIAWSFERSGLLKNDGDWYYQTVDSVVNNEGDVMQALDVLARDVGVRGVFSDWPGTVTYYANCMKLH
jgi:glycerophosphoryl diester phosphodiesterase